MNAFNVKQTVEQALVLMEQIGVRANTVRTYRFSGFGTIVRHFTGQGITDVTNEMLDAFVLEQRACFESGEISSGKWSLIRRSRELLKQCVEKNSLDMSYLRPWDSVLQKPRQSANMDYPTPEQMADPDCLFSLIWRTRQELIRLGLKENTVRHYTSEGMAVIWRKHTSLGLEHYSESLTAEMVADIGERYYKGQVGHGAYKNLRKAASLIAEMHLTGMITLTPLQKWGFREPLSAFAQLLQHFCDNALHNGTMEKSTVVNAKSTIRKFFFELEARGFECFDGVSLVDINESITHMAKDYTSGLGSAIFIVRKFLRHLHETGFTSKDLSLAIPEMVASRSTFREGFSHKEMKLLLAAPDRETSTGKRDFAIMLLAVQTGLRGCDVANIKRDNIDWRTKEIRIIQRKTGKPLSLPLSPESGNAIADYLLHGRPESNLPYVFLCCTGVKRPLNNRSARCIVTKYLKRTEFVSTTPRRGFHSFRQSFGTNLLQNEVPMELLRQLLGHSKIDSLKPYLSVDEQNLKKCSLGLVAIRKVGEQA